MKKARIDHVLFYDTKRMRNLAENEFFGGWVTGTDKSNTD